MTNLRKRLAFIAISLAAVSAGAAALGACSSTEDTPKNDGGTPEGGGIDSPTGDTGTDTDGGTDAGADTFVPIEAGTLSDFITLSAQTACNRLRDCCGGPTKFDVAKCLTDYQKGGWNNSTRDLTITGVATGGKVTYDPVAGSACLTAIRNITCTNTPIAEYKNANEKCFAAAKGTVAVNGACLSNAECVSTAFCDVGTNTCATLKNPGDTCTVAIGECAYREATGANRCLDPGTGTRVCGGAIASGGACDTVASDFDCQTGSCYFDPDGGATCETKVGLIENSCSFYAVGDGG